MPTDVRTVGWAATAQRACVLWGLVALYHWAVCVSDTGRGLAPTYAGLWELEQSPSDGRRTRGERAATGLH